MNETKYFGNWFLAISDEIGLTCLGIIYIRDLQGTLDTAAARPVVDGQEAGPDDKSFGHAILLHL